ncbi:alpha-galactosidase-like [Folsomia candida]|uniref:alpha-galactosidase-like n=1 Tax=Folsomia candida TaxID=158441 RepID=UPI000B8FD08F|nr:alpha-galactosidase-like [Folsomia candida]
MSPDVAAWRSAFEKTGRPVILEISWELDITFISDWTASASGWRIDTDVECYCDTLVRWTQSVVQRFADIVPWIDHAGPGRWNDLDTINVGNGTMDGLTEDERRSYMTLWAISCAPLYIGDDLSFLDEFGLTLLTNREVIAINQNGIPARPVTPGLLRQVWWAPSIGDTSFIVAMFNLAGLELSVAANWADFGFTGAAEVYDVWEGIELGVYTSSFAVRVPTHGCRLIRVTPLLAK